MNNKQELLISELENVLKGGGAHVTFSDAVAGLPAELRGVIPDKLPYSIWQLVDHIRIALWDMLEFSRDANHQSPKWPDEYWAKDPAPADDAAWDKALTQIDNYLEEFIDLLHTKDLYKPFAHGTGQNLLREALQIADHNAYHTGEILAIRRLLGAWK